MSTHLPDTRSFKDSAYAHLAEVGKALSNATRLEVLELLVQAPRSVESLANEIGHSVANTSHHLQALKRAHLVKSERAGLHVIYTVAGEDVGLLLMTLQRVAGHHVAALEKLTKAYFEERDGLEAVDRETLLERLKSEDVILIDVRPEHEFMAGHLPGALSVQLDALESRFADMPRERKVVAYCRGPYCALSADAARRLRELGFDARRSDVTVVDSTREGAS